MATRDRQTERVNVYVLENNIGHGFYLSKAAIDGNTFASLSLVYSRCLGEDGNGQCTCDFAISRRSIDLNDGILLMIH